MKRIWITAAATIAVFGAPALAQSADSAAKPEQKKTCRMLTPTGSFMATRVCNTQADWRRFDGSNQKGVGDFRRALNMTSTNERNGDQ